MCAHLSEHVHLSVSVYVCSWQGLPAEEGTEGGEVLRGEEDPSPLNLGITSGPLLPHWQALWNGRA